MKLTKIIITVLFTLSTMSLFAYVPDNVEENAYGKRITAPFFEVGDLIKDGIKSIRQEVVSSEHANVRGSELKNGRLSEVEAGKEEVTSKEIVYYEPKEELYEAREVMDEIFIWMNMYRTTDGDDVVTYKKMREYVKKKSKLLDKLINALKYEKDNKDSVIKLKQKLKTNDKYYKRYSKRIKGKILLIEGKPLPEPEDDED